MQLLKNAAMMMPSGNKYRHLSDLLTHFATNSDIGPCHLDFKTTTFDDKNTSFQPTIVVTYISAFLVLNRHFIMF
jgi:hypothetical protein